MTNVCFNTLEFIKAMLKIFRKRLRGRGFAKKLCALKKERNISFLFLGMNRHYYSDLLLSEDELLFSSLAIESRIAVSALMFLYFM